jgi:hypothetical protein
MQKSPKIIPSGYGNYVGVRYNGELSSQSQSDWLPVNGLTNSLYQ